MKEALKKHIIEKSVSNNINTAIQEWSVTHSIWSEYGEQCPCGKDIKEVCFIENNQNGSKTYVGNSCVNNFMGIDTDKKLFSALKKITLDKTASPNKSLFEYALKKGYIYENNEEKFYEQMVNKRNKSTAQKSWLSKINNRIINQNKVRI